MALQAALEGAIPGCDDLSSDASRGITAFTPHLSLGQWQDKQQLLQDMQASIGQVLQVAAGARVCGVVQGKQLDYCPDITQTQVCGGQ